MYVQEHINTSEYEQEILYHLSEIKYWEEVAENVAEEFRLAIGRQKYHEKELNQLREPI